MRGATDPHRLRGPTLHGLTRSARAEVAGAQEALALLQRARLLLAPAVAAYTVKPGQEARQPSAEAAAGARAALPCLEAIAALRAAPGPAGDGARWALGLSRREVRRLARIARRVGCAVAAPWSGEKSTATPLTRQSHDGNGVAMGFDRDQALRDLALCKVRPASRRAPVSASAGGLTQHVVLAYVVATADGDGCCAVGIGDLDKATGVGEAAGRRSLRALTLAGLLEVAASAPGDKVTYRVLRLGRGAQGSEVSLT